MLSCEICEIFKNNCLKKICQLDASINKRQQDAHALLGKKKNPI